MQVRFLPPQSWGRAELWPRKSRSSRHRPQPFNFNVQKYNAIMDDDRYKYRIRHPRNDLFKQFLEQRKKHRGHGYISGATTWSWGIDSVNADPDPLPEVTLHWAVLMRAVHDLVILQQCKERGNNNADYWRWGQDAEAWILGHYPGRISFRDCCEVCDLDRDYVRDALMRQRLIRADA